MEIHWQEVNRDPQTGLPVIELQTALAQTHPEKPIAANEIRFETVRGNPPSPIPLQGGPQGQITLL